MESKRIYHDRYFKGLRAFNRTSMESKHVILISESPAAFVLLIEPVWNRNLFVSEDVLPSREPFNRTSMESKLP